MEEGGIKHICLLCDKGYSSSKSLWNHNKKYHKVENVTLKTDTCHQEKVTKNGCNYLCEFCNKEFNFRQGLWRHTTTCKVKKEKEKNEETLNIMKELLNKQSEEMKKEIERLKIALEKSIKIHPKTLNKINKQLINQNSNNNNNNNIVNNTINIVQLGNENLIEVLSEKQKLRILERQALSLNDLVELIHISPKYKQFKNVCITNLQSSFGQKYDEKSKKFIAVNKNELLNEIVECRMYDIEKFYDENKDKMPPKKAEQIKLFIDRMNDDEDAIKGLKSEEIKLILYNNQDNINNAIVNLQQ